MLQEGRTPHYFACGTKGDTYLVCLAAAPALAVALWLGIADTNSTVPPSRPLVAAPPPTAAFEPSRFILNALLVPALEADVMPLRWVDPRPALHCGPDTTVRVNREPLLAGAWVPDAPFELEWQTDGCHPFGVNGPRFDGRVRLTVFREDWGFSAVVEPSSLRVAVTESETTLIQRGAASLPQFVEADEPDELRLIGSDRPLP